MIEFLPCLLNTAIFTIIGSGAKKTTLVWKVKARCRAMFFSALIKRDGDWFVARCMEVDVTSQGKTVEEAKANLKEAIELYIESFRDDISWVETEQDIIYARLDVAV